MARSVTQVSESSPPAGSETPVSGLRRCIGGHEWSRGIGGVVNPGDRCDCGSVELVLIEPSITRARAEARLTNEILRKAAIDAWCAKDTEFFDPVTLRALILAALFPQDGSR